MIHAGENLVLGVPVMVERKSIRRINLRVKPDGRIVLSIPKWWATLAQGEAFLQAKWSWATKTREAMLARASVVETPINAEDLLRLQAVLRELMAEWTLRLGEGAVPWKTRRMKTLWGSCHLRKHILTFNTELARVPRELVEYVVVHELTHLKVPDHGPAFQARMDCALPDWRLRRRRLRNPWGQ